jgi:hypothetical protein
VACGHYSRTPKFGVKLMPTIATSLNVGRISASCFSYRMSDTESFQVTPDTLVIRRKSRLVLSPLFGNTPRGINAEGFEIKLHKRIGRSGACEATLLREPQARDIHIGITWSGTSIWKNNFTRDLKNII